LGDALGSATLFGEGLAMAELVQELARVGHGGRR
jgi:hypothetical protein